MQPPLGPGSLHDTAPGAISAEALLTIRDAAGATGHHRATIKSDLCSGRYPAAVQEPTGRKEWRLPVNDLIAAGRLPASAADAVGEHRAAAREARATRELREQVIRLGSC